jgi:nitrogen fixation protein FixH
MQPRQPELTRPARPFTGWHMLAVVLGFFGVIIGVNIVMAMVAVGSFPGLVVENSYVASQNYNELLASGRSQTAAGWRLELTTPRGVLEATLADRDRPHRGGLTVTALVGRPSSTQADRVLDLTETGQLYRAPEPLPPGQWDVDVEARREGELVFRELRRVFVRPTEAAQ